MDTIERGDIVTFKDDVKTWAIYGDKFWVVSVDGKGGAYVAAVIDGPVQLPCRVENLQKVKMPWE